MLRFGKTPDERLHGLGSLQLHSMPLDPSKAREVLALAAFRDAGVPSPRTALAEVSHRQQTAQESSRLPAKRSPEDRRVGSAQRSRLHRRPRRIGAQERCGIRRIAPPFQTAMAALTGWIWPRLPEIFC